jgi:hypothetical protein
MDDDFGDRELLKRIRRVETYFYDRQTLNLALVMGLVVLGSLWSTVFIAFIEQTVFRNKEPHYGWWILIALVASVAFLLVIRALKAPLFLFA